LQEHLAYNRYEPPIIDLGNKNHSHTLSIDLIGFNKTILEVGTSTGYVSKILKERGNRVIGIEIDRESGTLAQQYCDRMIIGDIETLDLDETFKSEFFDVIVCGDVLEHLKNPATLLRKLRKFLKPEGYLVVSLPNFFHGDVLLNLLNGDFHYTSTGLLDVTHLRFFGLKNIYSLFADCDYQIKDIQTTNQKIGTTELKVDMAKLPRDLVLFIQSLPDSAVYQYIFRAYPSNNVPKPVLVETDINTLFFNSLKGSMHEVQEPLEREIGYLNSQITLKETQLNVKETQLNDLTARLNDREQRLLSIEKSIVWQLTMKIHNRIVEKLLPQNTRRRKCYDLGRAGGKILINDGYDAFHQSLARYFHKGSHFNDYQRWIKKNEYSPDELTRLKKISQNFSYRPKISILIPVWNTDEKWLRSAIDSVLTQVYDNWELCIVDGGSIKRHIPKILKKYAQKDTRIKVKSLDRNKGIAGNSNEALALATGEYIGFLDHDDELAPFALYEVVKLLNQNKDIYFIYSDEDKINDAGSRKDPFFKPDWSPEMFLSCNYLCHFSVIKKSLLDIIGGFRQGYDGSQDYDLFLRTLEKIDKQNIAHIPKILYHWRIIPESVASDSSAKPYAYDNAKKALSDAMKRGKIEINDIIDGPWMGSYRICYSIIGKPKICIIIPNKDSVEILKLCINSILGKTDYQNYEIAIVDNQSKEKNTFQYYDSLRNSPNIKILNYNKPFNFSALNNFAVSHVNGDYLVFLNNDTEIITPEWLSAMLEHAQREDIGAVGAKLFYPNNTIQHCGVILGLGVGDFYHVAGHPYCGHPDHFGYVGRISIVSNFSAVTGACMMIKKDIFDEIGGFDENLAIAYNDVDLCLKIREKGYFNVYTPYSQLYHYESKSRGYENTPEKQQRFLQEINYMKEKWGAIIDKGDPFYNPNMTLVREDFSIKL